MKKSPFRLYFTAFTLLLTLHFLQGQEPAAYLIFNHKGEKLDYEQMKKKIC